MLFRSVPTDFPVHLLITEATRAKGFKPERSAVGYFMNLLHQIANHRTVQRASSASATWAIATFDYEIVP